MNRPNHRAGRTLWRRSGLAALLGGVLFAASACDGENLFRGDLRGGVSARDSVPPKVEFLQPRDSQTYTRGEAIRVRIQLSDSTGLKQVSVRGFAFRNFPDTLSSTRLVVKYPEVTVVFPQGPQGSQPKDTIIVRDLLPNNDTVNEPVWLVAEAMDTLGVTSVDTVFLRPGPRIDILEPTSGSREGGALRLHVRAIDPVAGLSKVRVEITGAVNQVIERTSLNGKRDAEVIDEMIALPPTAGTIRITATVTNREELTVSALPVNVSFTAQAARDSIPPRVQRQLYTHAVASTAGRALRDRIELRDTLRLYVRADDGNGTGISELGAVVLIQPDSLPERTIVRRIQYPTPRPGAVQDSFTIVLSDYYQEVGDRTTFPQRFAFEVHGYAIDAAPSPGPNCAASVQETPESLPCSPPIAEGGRMVVGQTGRRYVSEVVAGTSLRLPAGSIIADMLPDTLPNQERLYLSNWRRNQVEVLQLRDSAFTSPVLVGSQPWGLFLVPGRGASDTLMVANSGGTSISFVPTDRLLEDSPKRLFTPNDALWEITETVVFGYLRYSVRKLEFSDRPQFVAQDRNKVILYSTQPTSAAVEGTLRRALADPTPTILNDQVRPEVRLIFGREAVTGTGASYAVARVDSILVRFTQNGNDVVRVCDHVPGYPDPAHSFCREGPAWLVLPELDSIRIRRVNAGFGEDSTDIFYDRGTWRRDVVGFKDTTYVAYSKDLSTIAFGEGDAAPVGRVLLYSAAPAPGQEGVVSSQGTADLISNAAERVMGVALNVNGDYGVARGLRSAYYFSNNVKQEGPLRLQGLFTDTVSRGNGGVALHPHHGSVAGGSTDNTMSFIATSRRSIKIIDTFHFFEMGEIAVRENVTGQLRATPPMPGVNTGLSPTHCEYTIAHLYGVSEAGAGADTGDRNVLMLNVRVKHLAKDPRRAQCSR